MCKCYKITKWFIACSPCTDLTRPFFPLSCCVLSSSASSFSLFFLIFLYTSIECTQTKSNYALRNVNLVLNYAIHTNHTLKHFLIRCSRLKEWWWCLFLPICFHRVDVIAFFLFPSPLLWHSPLFRLSTCFEMRQGKNARTSNKNSMPLLSFHCRFYIVAHVYALELNWSHVTDGWTECTCT